MFLNKESIPHEHWAIIQCCPKYRKIALTFTLLPYMELFSLPDQGDMQRFGAIGHLTYRIQCQL